VTESVFSQRVRAAGLSLWELGDLLGIHPHYLHPTTERFDSLPISVLVDLARRLDMHPADLVPELNSVLSNNRRTPQPEAAGDGPVLLKLRRSAKCCVRVGHGVAPWAPVIGIHTLGAWDCKSVTSDNALPCT
jgi:hypothetical protein